LTARADTERPTRSRRERPAKPALTRDGIIAVALEILRNEGLAKVTMRRIASVLDTGPASLYVYVRNTEDLHAQILDALLGSLTIPVVKRGSWRERLVELVSAYGMILFEYPELARMAMSTQPSGPHYLAALDVLLALLKEGGASDGAAGWGADLLLLYATAIAAEHGMRAITPGDDSFATLASEILAADPDRYPTVHRLGAVMLSGEGAERFRWQLASVINGVLMTPWPAESA
jgi:AcrR family transcriptional regulator